MIRIRLLFAAVLLALIASACGGAAGESGAPAAGGAAGESTSPLFGTFTTIDDAQIDLGSLEGQDVVLWFWAPW